MKDHKKRTNEKSGVGETVKKKRKKKRESPKDDRNTRKKKKKATIVQIKSNGRHNSNE